MADLEAYLRLDVADQKEVYGIVTYCGDTVEWTLSGLFASAGIGRPDTQFQGLVPDPTGDFLIQQPVYVFQSAGPESWLHADGSPLPLKPADVKPPQTAYYQPATEETNGTLYLRQVTGGPAAAADAVWGYRHDDDEGFALFCTRGGPAISPGADQINGAAFNFYAELSSQLPDGDTAPLPGTLRVCIEAGRPVRLEVANDAGEWVTADIGFGDSEALLAAADRRLLIDVCPLTNADYWADAYAAAPPSTYGKPPDCVAVTVGAGPNAQTLVYRAEGAAFPAGQVRITSLGGQWAVRPAVRRYLAFGSASLPELKRLREFKTEPQSRITGFVPWSDDPAGIAEVVGTLTGSSAVTGLLTIQTPDDFLDDDPRTQQVAPGGAGYLTCILSAAGLNFPAAGQGPSPVPYVVSYAPYAATEYARFSQAEFGIRRGVTCFFAEQDLSPASVVPAVRAAALVRGIYTASGYDDTQTAFWGLSGMGGSGFRWFWGPNGQRHFALDIAEGWRDFVPILWTERWDGQCHYKVMRDLGRKMGLPDALMDFPLCEGGNCPHYHLPTGTLREPIFQLPPQMSCPDAMRFLRSVSGERDPFTGVVQPMYLYFDRLRHLQYYPMPAGLLNIFALPGYDPVLAGLSQAKVFQAVPSFTDGYPVLNEFVRGSLESRATLDNIRTDIVLAGQRPSDGAILTGYYSNPYLGTDPLANPGLPGYVGVSQPFVDINRLYSSVEAIEVMLANAIAQTQFPSVSTDFTAHFQSSLDPLSVLGVLDPFTQGTDQPVPYYVTGITSTIEQVGQEWRQGSTVSGHLLGQAAS